MKTTYLNEYLENEIVYLPIGTLEWHGNHLPLETDIITAQNLCEKVSGIIPGIVLEPLYLATDKAEGEVYGMQRHLNKSLPGEIYFLEQSVFESVLSQLSKNILRDGFKKLIIITGHAGSAQIDALNKVGLGENIIAINPFVDIDIHVNHADEYETSLLWACLPDQEIKSRSIKVSDNDDYFKFIGYDPREKASLEIGDKLLKTMIDTTVREIKQGLLH